MQDADIIGPQIRAARGALGWSIRELSEGTGIGSATLVRYEAVHGVPKSRKGHLEALKAHFESAGIEFIGTPDDGPGVRLHQTQSKD